MSRFRISDLPAWRLGLIAIVLVSNMAVLFGWTLPRWEAVAPGGAGRGGLEAARQTLGPPLEQARDTYGRVLTAETDLETLRRRIVVESGSSGLMAAVEDAADQAGVRIRESNWQWASVDELGVVQLGMNLPVEGAYAALRRFLDAVTRADEFLVVQAVGLSPAAAGGAPGGTLRIELALSAFLEDPEAADSNGAASQPTAPARPATTTPERPWTTPLASLPAAPLAAAEVLRQELAALPALPVEPLALEVDLERLGAPRRPSPAPTRNLFVVATRPETAPPPVVQPPAPEVPVEPPMPLRLLGVLRVDGRLLASISDGVELHVVPAGTRLPNGFEVVEVGADYVVVVRGERRTRLNLEELSS